MIREEGVLTIAFPSGHSGATAWRRAQWWQVILGLAIVDTLALAVSFAAAYVVRFKTGVPLLVIPPHALATYVGLTWLVIPVWLGLFALYRLYDRDYLFVGFQEYSRVIHACTSGLVAIMVLSFLGRYEAIVISRGWLLLVWVASVTAVCCSRFAVRRVIRRLRSVGTLSVATLIVGANGEGRALAEQFHAEPGSGLRVIGFVDDTLHPGTAIVRDIPVLGRFRDLREIVGRWRIRQIVVASTALSRDQLLELYQNFGHDETLDLRLSSGLFEILTTGVRVQEASSVPLIAPQRTRITGPDAVLKTALDYLVASVALFALSPFLLVIALLVRLDSPGPALYRRRVLGRAGKPFDAFKFRTMVVDAEKVLAADAQLRQAFDEGYKLKIDPRVTRIGRLLRRTSLDELPQLLNVLRGEMSIIGPRMISPEEAARYGKWQLNLLTVKPGITGPWQVHGRSDLVYDERVKLSMNYIRNYSIWLDLEILIRTVGVVLRGRGAY